MTNTPNFTITHHDSPNQAELDHILHGHEHLHSHDEETGKTIYDKPLFINGDTKIKPNAKPKATKSSYFNAFCEIVDIIVRSNKKNTNARDREVINLLYQAAARTKIFFIEGDTLYDIKEETFEQLTKTRLPFPIISIVTSNGVTCFIETKNEITCVNFFAYDSSNYLIKIGKHDKINVEYTQGIDFIEAKATLKDFMVIMPHKNKTMIRTFDPSNFPTDEQFEEFQTDYEQSLSWAYLVIGSINLPSKFVLEIKPTNSPRKKKSRIPRYSERPIYTTLTPNKIRQVLKTEKDVAHAEGSPKTPHDRRGHWRTLNSPKFKNKQGEIIWIDPVWIGRSEAVVGNKKYKVRLDL